MRSKLQKQSSRANSKRSTGPRTPAGKAVSSGNALKSGIHAESEIIEGEDPAALAALAAAYANRFSPAAPDHCCLVDVLVHSEWTLRRLRRAEAQLWDGNIKSSSSIYDENPVPLGSALNYLHSKVFERLQRRINATQRNYQLALKQLMDLQEEKAVEPAAKSAAVLDEQPPATSPASPEAEVPALPAAAVLGSVPSPQPAPSPKSENLPASSPKAPVSAPAALPNPVNRSMGPLLGAF